MRRRYWLRAGLLLAVVASVLVVVHHGSAGSFVGTIPLPSQPTSAVVDPSTHHVFIITSADNSVTMLDAASGSIVRTVGVGSDPVAVVAAGRSGRIFVGNNGDNSVSMLDAATGIVLRTVLLPGVSYPMEAVDEQAGHVFVAGNCNVTGKAWMLDARSGAILHAVDVGVDVWDVAVDARTHRAFVTNNGDGTVSVLDSITGKVLRTVRVGRMPHFLAVDAVANHVFVINDADSTVSMLDASSGSVLRTVAVGFTPQTLAIDAQTGRAFLTDGDGTVRVLDTRTGAVLRTIAVGGLNRPQFGDDANAVDVVLDARSARVFVLDASAVNRTGMPMRGSVSVLDARSGRVLRRLSVGQVPVSLAMDETTARLFVANQESGRTARDWMPSWLRRGIPWLMPPAPRPMHGSVSVLDISRV